MYSLHLIYRHKLIDLKIQITINTSLFVSREHVRPFLDSSAEINIYSNLSDYGLSVTINIKSLLIFLKLRPEYFLQYPLFRQVLA